MNSSLGVSRAQEESQNLPIELGQSQPAARPSASRFRGVIALCEIAADLLTITAAVTLGYVIYNATGLGRHIYYPFRAIWAVAAAFAIVMVLMLDRVGA